MIARERELTELCSRLDAVAAGAGAAALISGEPGIGKTTLADALAAEALSHGFRVVWGRCWEVIGGPPFWPWIQILRVLLDEQERSNSEAASEIAFIRRCIPELKPQMSEPAEPEPPDSTAQRDPEVMRFRLFEAVLRLLIAVSRAKPWLLILDDCHAADESSLRLLDFIVKQIRQTRIMLVVTYRDADIKRRPAAYEIVSGLAREAQSYPLHNLAENEVQAFVAQNAPGIDQAGLVQKLFKATEGNPFFLGEIINLLAARYPGAKPDDWNTRAFEIPDQVGAAIRRRCDLLSVSTRRVLDAAAAIGVEFDQRLLARIVESGTDLAAALLEARNFALVRADPQHPARYKFVHALFAETVSADQPPEIRAKLHLDIARALIADKSEPAEIARHLLEALPGGDLAEAVDYARRAGRRAIEQLAYGDAAAYFQLALGAIENYGSPYNAEYCELMIDWAEAKTRAGNFTEAIEKSEQAAQIARNLSEPRLFARAAFGMGSLAETPGILNRKLISHLEAALEMLGDTDDGWRAMLLARLAEALQWTDQEIRRKALAHEAITLARRVGDPVMLGDVLYRMYVSIINPDSAEERLATTTEILTLIQRNPRLGLRLGYMRMRDLLELSRIDELDREIQAYSQLADDLRQRHLGYAEAARAMRAMMDGRFEEAERLALEALNLGQSRGDTLAVQGYAIQLTQIRREQDRFAEMEPVINGFVVTLPDLALSRCAMALCYSELERRDDASFHFEQVAQEDFARVRRDPTWLGSMALLSEICVYLGDSARAPILYRNLLPYKGRQASLDIYVTYGPVALYLGMLAGLLGKFDEAEAHFELALSQTARAGARPWHAHARYQYGLLLRSRGEPDLREKCSALLKGALVETRALKMKALERKLLALEPDGAPVADQDQARQREGTSQTALLCLRLEDSGQRVAILGERGWRDVLHRFHSIAYEQFELWKGHKIDEGADFLVATFADPAAALEGARAIGDAIRPTGTAIRAVLFAGDGELSREETLALSRTLREQVLPVAAVGEVLVAASKSNPPSSKGFRLIPKSVVQLPGLVGECHLFQTELPSAARRNAHPAYQR